MKARVKDNKLILSIGMIVKNEEKYLGDCLESLQSLMDAVPSELIIVDTGSTDRTVEIAQQYTDQIYDFEWINDFAAARNCGLEKAKGQWFLQVDADEQLLDASELVEFLTNEKKNKKYNTAEIICRSYTNKEFTSFSDASITRLFRLGIGNKYHNPIHEVPDRVAPIIELSTTLKHYGYIYETPEAQEKKQERNNTILAQELEKDPDNLRIIDHYATSCSAEKREEILKHARELCKQNPQHYYFSNIYWKVTRHLYEANRFEELEEAAAEYFSMTTQEHVGDMEIRLNLGNTLYKIEKFEKATEEFEHYLDLYDRFQDGSLKKQDNMCAVAERATPQDREIALCQLTHCYFQCENYEKVLQTVKLISFNCIAPSLLSLVKTMIQHSIEKTSDYASLFDLDTWSDNKEAVETQRRSMKAFLANTCLELSGTENWEALIGLAQGKETPMARIVLAASESPAEGFSGQVLRELGENRDLAEDYGPILLIQGMRYGWELLPLLYQIGRDNFKQSALRIVEKVPDAVEIVSSYRPTEEEQNDLLWRAWMVEMDSRAFGKADEDVKLPLLRKLMEDFSWYVNNLYRVNLLCPEKLAVLPSPHRFGYWAGLALDAEKAGNDRDYIRYLREAARSCPEMADAVKLLLKEFEENNEEFQRRKEREQLAQKIKGMIEGMILGGQAENAKSVLEKYELIAPDDADIPSLKAAILQQTPFPEI